MRMTCEKCKNFDGFDAVRSTVINCMISGELNTYDAEDMCLDFEEKVKRIAVIYPPCYLGLQWLQGDINCSNCDLQGECRLNTFKGGEKIK